MLVILKKLRLYDDFYARRSMGLVETVVLRKMISHHGMNILCAMVYGSLFKHARLFFCACLGMNKMHRDPRTHFTIKTL